MLLHDPLGVHPVLDPFWVISTPPPSSLTVETCFEIPVTWYRTPKWESQKSACGGGGRGGGTGAGKNGVAGQSAGTGAGRLYCLCFPKGPSLPAPVPALRPAPPFLPAPPSALFPWTGKPCFSNRALVKNFWGSEMPLNVVFLRPQNWSRRKPFFLKHYYRRQASTFLELPFWGPVPGHRDLKTCC